MSDNDKGWTCLAPSWPGYLFAIGSGLEFVCGDYVAAFIFLLGAVTYFLVY